MINTIVDEILRVRNEARIIHPEESVENAIQKIAYEINMELTGKNPVVISLMTGAIVFTGKLLPLLEFPLQLEYMHATRYRNRTSGNDLVWKKEPEIDMQDRCVLILDDILDQGITLEAVVNKCIEANANRVLTAVLVDKQINVPREFAQADFTGLSVPDQYVFGYGMDYKGYLRNVPGIYAVAE